MGRVGWGVVRCMVAVYVSPHYCHAHRLLLLQEPSRVATVMVVMVVVVMMMRFWSCPPPGRSLPRSGISIGEGDRAIERAGRMCCERSSAACGESK